jgi:hypothetical protein
MLTNDKFILDANGEPIPCRELLTWAAWYEEAQKNGARRVALDVIGNTEISTVFLSLDHAFGGGPPILWETMVIKGE